MDALDPEYSRTFCPCCNCPEDGTGEPLSCCVNLICDCHHDWWLKTTGERPETVSRYLWGDR